MLIGYARTSTADQTYGLDAQLGELETAGCERAFSERISSVAAREQLEEAIDFCRKGDTLAVTKLDRLARSVADLVGIEQRLKAKGVKLKVLSMDLDTSTPTGKLMINLLGSVAQFEREIVLERQREGIARAKAEGKYKGRQPTARAKADEVLALKRDGVGATEIARRMGIGRASVYRILGDAVTPFPEPTVPTGRPPISVRFEAAR